MNPAPSPAIHNSLPLPDYLRTVRQLKGLTLREVQEATDNNVSNAYLSQLETGKIQKPSPNILHALGQVYGVEYTLLMEKAGYLTSPVKTKADARHGRLATLSKMDLTAEEEEQVALYLNFLRQTRGTRAHAAE